MNINRNFDSLRDDELGEVIKTSYLPLLDVLDDLELKTTLFFTGFSLETLERESPNVLEKTRDLIQRGIVELGNHTYGHPIIPLISNDDLKLHINRSKILERKIFGAVAKCFYPPEFCTDPSLPMVLQNEGFEWMLLHNSNYLGAYGHTLKDVFKIGEVRGVLESRMLALTAYGDADEWIRGQIHGVFEGSVDPQRFASSLIETINRQTNECINPVVCLYTDSETPYFNKDSSNLYPVDHFRKAIEFLLKNGNLRSVSASDLLSDQTLPKIDLRLKMRETYKPFDLWVSGSEKLDRLIHEARLTIDKVLESSTNSAKIDSMIRHYLLAQGSDARSVLSERRMRVMKIGKLNRHGNLERTRKAYEHAIIAKIMAQEILDGK